MISNTVRFRLDLIVGETECSALLIYFFPFFFHTFKMFIFQWTETEEVSVRIFSGKIAHFYISKLVKGLLPFSLAFLPFLSF